MKKVIIMHGLEPEVMIKAMRAVKAVLDDPKSVAFASSTPSNLKWPLEKTIDEIWEDHDYLRKNPPEIPEKPDTKQ